MFFGGFRSFMGLDKSSSTSSPTPTTTPPQSSSDSNNNNSNDRNKEKSNVQNNNNNTLKVQQQEHPRRKSFSEMLHNLITENDNLISDKYNHSDEEDIEENNKQPLILPPNHIGIEFSIGTVTLASDLSFTQYFSASIFDTCLTFSVKRSDEQEELLGDEYKQVVAHSSRIRKSPLSDGFTFKWKGEKVILPIQLSEAEYQQVMTICNSASNNSNESHYVFEHSSSLESKKILPQIAMQLDNISATSEMLHNYIMKCKPHVNFIGEAVYDINRLMDFRSRSVDMIELSLKRGKDKTGVVTIGMKLILPQKFEGVKHHISPNNSLESLHDYETISFDDSFILSGLKKKPSSEKLTSICDSNFDLPQNNSENLYEESHYEILEEVGRGSFGKVYKAVRKSDRVTVGIKKINCDDINNANDALVEFWPIRKISYPQLISIQDIYFSKSDNEFSSLFTLCLVMEYMDDGDLEQFINGHKDQGQTIQEAHLLSLMIQMSAGLNHLHLNGLLHRDIKPKNILLSSKFKECKIGDFGLIYNLRSLTSKNLNDTISSAGTIKYQSPECHIGVKDITELDSKEPIAPTSLFMNYIYSSDIWSMGIVFLELVGCEILNFSPYIMAMKDQQQFHGLIRKRCSKYHEGFANLIISMLSLEPKDRPDSEKLVRTLLNLKKDIFGQQRSVKIHPVIEIHRQLLSVGKSVKGIFLGTKDSKDDHRSQHQQDSSTSSSESEKSNNNRRTLSLHSVKDFLSGIHKVDEDTPTPEDSNQNTSSSILNRDVFSFGLW
ncbi:predicted protein [Naegleria gruberi]|uniref:Predicted protein n=1 Tax=Naegleria gruberi TaxID=5762 RepID=D2VUQ0_NAEGR|nr:uncharacterized protein NAEGRDRAFT_72742 [Naegleria gruberi]EFC39545.1 predicted protein [Naegleria gruberi]|eukprot:XP_002672289.1 predicted protein [Naegleria gruberi strain NEG-M]